MIDRRDLITGFLASGIAAAVPHKGAAQGNTHSQAKLPIPEGKMFEGMSGAWAAM